jgi:hypothetical protein
MWTHANVAELAHNLNRDYCRMFGLPIQPPWEELPESNKEGRIKAVATHAETFARGEKVTPQSAHKMWMDFKAGQGWTYGPEIDGEKKTHPNMREWELLDDSEKIKDRLFIGLIRTFFSPSA